MTQCILDDLMFSRAACPCAREATVAPSTLVIVVLEGWRHQAGQSSAMFPSVSRGSPDITRVSAGKLTFRGCSSNSGGAIKVTAGGVTRRCRWHQEKRTFLMSEGCSPCSLGIWCYRSKKVKQDAWISAKLIQMISIYCNLLCVGTLRLNFRTAPSSSRIALQILAELSAFLAVGNNDCQIHARCFGPMEHSESPRVGRRRGNGRSLFEVTKRSLRSALVISSTAPALAPSVVAGLWRRLVALWKWRVRNRCLSNMAALKIFAWAAWVCIFAIVIQKKMSELSRRMRSGSMRFSDCWAFSNGGALFVMKGLRQQGQDSTALLGGKSNCNCPRWWHWADELQLNQPRCHVVSNGQLRLNNIKYIKWC